MRNLQFENAVLDLFEDNRISLDGANSPRPCYESRDRKHRETKRAAAYQYFWSEVREMSARDNDSWLITLA